MRRTIILFLLFTIQILTSQESGFNLQGAWEGVLTFNGREIDIIVIFEKDKEEWSGKLSSKTQQLKDITISNIVLNADQLDFDVPLAGGKWSGTFKEKENKLIGDWIQGPYKAPLLFAKLDEVPEFKVSQRWQTPKKPYPYTSEEVIYHNKQDGTKLGATLTIPNGKGPFPAAILLTVAGANDRDQTFGSPVHKPYLVLADYLTKNGIAVLRADDRGVGESTGNLFNATIKDFAHDALAGFDFLKEHPRIDIGKIGFIGNSEGSLVGPLAESINKEVAFIITLGGIGITGTEVILDQIDNIGKLSNLDETEINEMRKQTKVMFDIILNESDSLTTVKKMKTLLEKRKTANIDTSLFLVPSSIEEQIHIFSSPWYKYQIKYDPAPILQQITCPFLALHGDIDPFVVADKNLTAIASHLQTAKNQHYAIIKLKRINHIFQDAKSGSPADYNTNETSFSPRALELIVNWLKVTL